MSDGEGGGATTESAPGDEAVSWRERNRRRLAELPAPVRYGIYLALFVAFGSVLRATGGVGWLRERPLATAVPVLLLGLVSLAFAVGPDRWIESEAARGRKNVLQPGVQRLSRSSTRTQRIFYGIAGLLISALGVAGLVDAF